MPAVLNTLVRYDRGQYYYERPEWVMDHALDNGLDLEPITSSETSFVMDWRIDNDGRLVSEYVKTQAEQRMDRSNDVYLDDVKGISIPKDKPTMDVLFGYNLHHYGENKVVTCWYCDRNACQFDYSDFKALCPQGYDEDRTQRAFCYAMLEHFNEHRDGTLIPGTPDLPYVTTVFPGRTIYRADGSVAAVKPDVTRTWRINGALLGPSAKWFDPTQRSASIASEFGEDLSPESEF